MAASPSVKGGVPFARPVHGRYTADRYRDPPPPPSRFTPGMAHLLAHRPAAGVVIVAVVVSAVALASEDIACATSSPATQGNLGGCDLRQLAAAKYSSCKAACCATPGCQSWNWDSNLTASQRPRVCHEGGCCWLKSCPGSPGKTCGGGGAAGCESWSGAVYRPPSPPPPPPPPPPCPKGQACFWNQGTRSGVTKAFDCEVRKHAWEFAKGTLPHRGNFTSAYDALQLHACGVQRPTSPDVFTPPVHLAPSKSALIYASASAPPGGDGGKTKPFQTLEDAVDAAEVALRTSSRATVLLGEGTYHTTGVVLTAAHSGLTIQNHAGANAVVSGAVPIVNAKGNWSVHNAATNTWRLDTRGQQLAPEYGMRVGSRRAIRAKFPNGDPETAAT